MKGQQLLNAYSFMKFKLSGLASSQKIYILCYSLIIGDDRILFTLQGSNILMTEADLNGTWRVAVDGMATEKECKMLIKLAEVCSLFLLNVHR